MSDLGSPASSIDYLESDYSSEGEDAYNPRANARNTKQPVKAAKGNGSVQIVSANGTKIRINTKGLQPVANADGEAGRGLQLKEAVDLSGQDLKADHGLRPLWVDELGNMWVDLISSSPDLLGLG
jgi:DNA excision repair protein ERCC-3